MNNLGIASLAGLDFHNGLSFLLRGLSHTGRAHPFGGNGGRVCEVRKTITIAAPLPQVFAVFARYEQYPLFLPRVREVRLTGFGRSHWVVTGPAGLTARWDAVVTRFEPNRLLAWRSEPGSAFANAGVLRFARTSDVGTQVDLRLSYTPVGGVLGRLVASLVGADPERLLDEELARFKSFLEGGVGADRSPHAPREDYGLAR